MSGPYGLAFEVPEEMDANLILIGTGTGIAPFRAFVKHIYQERARTGRGRSGCSTARKAASSCST